MDNNNAKKKPATPKKKVPNKKKPTMQAQPKKQSKKLTRAEYDDRRQIEWLPFDPYAD